MYERYVAQINKYRCKTYVKTINENMCGNNALTNENTCVHNIQVKQMNKQIERVHEQQRDRGDDHHMSLDMQIGTYITEQVNRLALFC